MDDATVAEHVDRIAEQGYTIVPDAIEPDLRRRARRRPAAARARPRRGAGRPTASRAPHRPHLQPAGPRRRSTQQVPVHPEVLPIVEGVLDPGCLVSSLSSIAIDPGETAQPIHADDQLIPLPKPHVPDGVQHHVGAHRLHRGERRHPPRARARTCADHSPTTASPYDSIPAEMAKGSVLVWHGSLWHGGGANTTDERRTGIAMNYCAGWIRQQENQQLGIPIRRWCAPSSPGSRRLVRLRHLQRPDRPHRQARPRRAAGRGRRGRRADGLGRHRLTSVPPLADVLQQIETWESPHAAAAVVTPSGLVASHGDVEHPFALGLGDQAPGRRRGARGGRGGGALARPGGRTARVHRGPPAGPRRRAWAPTAAWSRPLAPGGSTATPASRRWPRPSRPRPA